MNTFHYSCTTPQLNPNGNYERWVIMMYQYWLISCYKCTPAIQATDNGGGYAHVRSGRCMGKLCALS